MIILESRVIKDDEDKGFHCPTGKYVDGYFLTIDDLLKLVRDFQVDSNNLDGLFVIDNELYIKAWLEKHKSIVKEK